MNKKWLVVGAALFAVAGKTGGLALAKDGSGEQKVLLSEAKITVAQAITAAEQHVHGKASKAELENENGSLVYSVAVNAQGKRSEVLVDAKSSKVLKVEQDDEEHEAEGNENDED